MTTKIVLNHDNGTVTKITYPDEREVPEFITSDGKYFIESRAHSDRLVHYRELTLVHIGDV